MSLTKCPEGHLFSSRRYGNICPYCNQVVTLGTKKNVVEEDPNGNFGESLSLLGELEVMNPVTGWLVCIEGPPKGRDYRIFTEKNFLGRSEQMDIQVLGDNKIAKKNHAIFVYDPRKRQTLVLPGDSHGLVYVNGDAIYTPVELLPYDMIEIGQSKFLFIPLCGENFEWEEITEDKEINSR